MSESQPGVRRLCVAALTCPPGLLSTACRLRDGSELYLSAQPVDGVEMGFAPPGIHEAAVVRWLTWAVEALCPARPGADEPAKMAFHVGITKVQGEGFGGAAPLRVRTLLRDPAIHRAVAGCQRLAVIMSDGLYDDLHTEGLTAQEWRRVPAAGAWVRG
jgi:hypothetical protein